MCARHARKSAEAHFEARVIAAAVSVLDVHLDYRRSVVSSMAGGVIVFHGLPLVAFFIFVRTDALNSIN